MYNSLLSGYLISRKGEKNFSRKYLRTRVSILKNIHLTLIYYFHCTKIFFLLYQYTCITINVHITHRNTKQIIYKDTSREEKWKGLDTLYYPEFLKRCWKKERKKETTYDGNFATFNDRQVSPSGSHRAKLERSQTSFHQQPAPSFATQSALPSSVKYPSYELYDSLQSATLSLWSKTRRESERSSAQTGQRVFCLWTGFFLVLRIIYSPWRVRLPCLSTQISLRPSHTQAPLLLFVSYPSSTIPPLTSSFPFHGPKRSSSVFSFLFFFFFRSTGPCRLVPGGTMHFKAALIPHERGLPFFLSFFFFVVLVSAGLINEPDSRA